ncbi:MAG: tetratricopeptide repeat protein [Candidatus Thiodiazotropha lotti]|nr:tetratricopeptide repeat protein [Candidatus Thiodiazotropha lotti]
MKDATGKDLATQIAEELGEDCSRQCLETGPDYYGLFEALVRNVGLKEKNDSSGIVEHSEMNKGEHSNDEAIRYLDYYCGSYMRVTEKDSRFNDLKKCIQSFDNDFIPTNWRRFGTDNRRISEERAEIFICCSAFVHGRSLKRHLAEFFSYCRHGEKIKLTCLENHQNTINTLITEELGPSTSKGKEPQVPSIQDHLSVTKEIEKIKKDNNFYPYGKYGMKSKDKSKIEIAFKQVEQLLTLAPGYVPLLTLKTYLLSILGRLDEAHDVSKNLYVTEYQNIEVSIAHGTILSILGEIEQSLKVFKNAQSFSYGLNNPILAYNAGFCLERLNRNEEAIVELCRAIELDSDLVRAYHALGAVYQKTRQYKKSEVILKKALRIAPDEVKLIEGLIDVLKQQGKHDEANVLIKTINHDELSEYKSSHLKAVAAFEENKFIESLEIMTEVIRKQEHDDFVTDKDRAKAFLDLAFLYDAQYVKDKNRERYSLAKHYYERAIEYDPEFSTALFKAAFFCLGDKEYEKCQEYLDKLEKTNNFDYIKAEKIEEVYIALAVLAKNHLPEIDHQILFKWCNEKYPESMEWSLGQIYIYLQDRKYKKAKDFINKLDLQQGRASENSKVSESARTIRLLRDALNSVDVRKIESEDYYTEEYLKVLEACTTEEVKATNREFWMQYLYMKCDCFFNMGLINKDVERLQAALLCYEALLKETLPHEDLDNWRMINIEIGDVYNALWVNSGDIAYLEKGIEYINRLLLDTEYESDRSSWLFFAKFLAPRYLELYLEKSNRELLDESLKHFEAVFRENEKLPGSVDMEYFFYLKAGDAYNELDNLEPDTKHLEKAEKFYRVAADTEDSDLLIDANISIAKTLQNIGLRTGDHETLLKALTMVEGFRDAVSKRRSPDEWAFNHSWTAEIKYQIGVFNHDLNQFLNSAKAYKEVFDLSRKGISREDHVFWKNGRGLSLLRYCENNNKYKLGLLNDAIKCFLSVLDILMPDEAPWEYANTQNSLGDAYLLLGRRKGSLKHIKMALETFREAFATFKKYSYAEHVPELSEKIHALTQELEVS